MILPWAESKLNVCALFLCFPREVCVLLSGRAEIPCRHRGLFRFQFPFPTDFELKSCGMKSTTSELSFDGRNGRNLRNSSTGVFFYWFQNGWRPQKQRQHISYAIFVNDHDSHRIVEIQMKCLAYFDSSAERRKLCWMLCTMWPGISSTSLWIRLTLSNCRLQDLRTWIFKNNNNSDTSITYLYLREMAVFSET